MMQCTGRTRPHGRRALTPWRASAAAALLLLLAAAPLHAQEGAPPQSRGAAAVGDYMIGPPIGSLSLRAGWVPPRPRGDVFDHTIDTFTAEEADFGAWTLGLELAFRVAPRLDWVVGLAGSYAAQGTEYREFVDEDDLPIEQSTRLLQVPVTTGVRLYPLPRGRAIGSFVWIPARVIPYVGAVAGLVHYRFEQSGEFVDYEDLAIFDDTFVASGLTPTAQAFGGIDLGLGPRSALQIETRYAWAAGRMGGNYQGFGPVDLGGFQATVGYQLRF
jgi:hypothetical protein